SPGALNDFLGAKELINARRKGLDHSRSIMELQETNGKRRPQQAGRLGFSVVRLLLSMAALIPAVRLAIRKNVGGKIFNETFFEMKGWKDRFFFIDRRAIPDAMAWRHHDSHVFYAFPNNDFSIQDVRTLTERIIDLRPVPPGLFFGAGLATTWDFPGFFPVFKDTGGNGNIL
ncbi:hypothetical protein Tco_1257186, partial [Tanacetum coccineum]